MRLAPLLVIVALVPSLAIAKPKKKKAKGKKPAAAKVEPAAPVEPTPPPTPAAGVVGPGPAAGAGEPADAAPVSTPPPPPEEAAAPADTADVDTLRQEYLALRDELFRSSARASAVASQLFSTRIQVRLTYTTARFYNPAKATIRLDGATVYENASGAIAGDDGIRFDGYVAPGRHLITFHVEAIGKDDDSFTSTTESQITVKAIAGKDLLVAAKAHDAGNIAYEWKRKESGTYGLGIDVSVKTQPRAGGK